MMPRLSVMVVLALVGLGCRKEDPQIASDQMYILGSALTKLSSAVESVVHYEPIPPGVGEAQLFEFATSDDPGLLRPFAEYKVRVRTEQKHGVVLVCTKNSGRALLEDLGCTGPMDRHHWRDREHRPCEFTVSPSSCP